MRRQLLGASGKGLEVPGVVRLLVRSVHLLLLLLLRLYSAAQHAVVPYNVCRGLKRRSDTTTSAFGTGLPLLNALFVLQYFAFRSNRLDNQAENERAIALLDVTRTKFFTEHEGVQLAASLMYMHPAVPAQ